MRFPKSIKTGKLSGPPHGSLTLWGKVGGKLPLALLAQGACSSQSRIEELVHKMPCLFCLCAHRILEPSRIFISRKWSFMGLNSDWHSSSADLKKTPLYPTLPGITLPLQRCPGCSTWWSLGIWRRVLRWPCFAYITETLAGFPNLLSSSPNFQRLF